MLGCAGTEAVQAQFFAHPDEDVCGQARQAAVALRAVRGVGSEHGPEQRAGLEALLQAGGREEGAAWRWGQGAGTQWRGWAWGSG